MYSDEGPAARTFEKPEITEAKEILEKFENL